MSLRSSSGVIAVITREALARDSHAPASGELYSMTFKQGETMEIETLNAINEGMYPSLLMMIEVIMLITILLAIAGFAIYLACIAWLCFAETRRSITVPQAARANTWKSAPGMPGAQRHATVTHEEFQCRTIAAGRYGGCSLR